MNKKTSSNNYIFKLILILEIERLSKIEKMRICDFYKTISVETLGLMLFSANAFLSRGSLPLAEDFMIRDNIDRKKIKEKLDDLSDYRFYFSSDSIYSTFMKYLLDNDIDSKEVLHKLKELALNGVFDKVILENDEYRYLLWWSGLRE